MEARAGACQAPSRRKAEAGIEWMEPGIKGRVRYLKGQGVLRHATTFLAPVPQRKTRRATAGFSLA